MIAPNTAPPTARAGFLAAVQASGVLTAGQLATAAAGLPPEARTAPEVAKALVAAGVLTAFQADRLLAGKADGFVLGQYVIQSQIGKGPVARVYKALHRAMNRPVAVKVLAADQTRDPARLAAFQAEARAAARLAHPNVVTVLDANQVGERFYLVLEYVEGTGADAAVRKGGPLPVARACEVARQVALGLQHAHDRGTAHGALTPGCVLLGRTGPSDRPAVKVTNFGLGRVATAAAYPVACDPADYRAPELFDPAAAPTPRSDLYSLGCVLYFLLTGRTPFPGVTPEDKARHHRTSDPVPVETLRPDVPPAVAELIRGLTAKDPAARPESAGDAATRLAPFAESDDPAARIDFNFPAPGSGAVPTPGGFLTGLLPASQSCSISGSLSELVVGTAAEVTDTSPWAGLDGSRTLDDAPKTAPVPRRPQPADPKPKTRRGAAVVALVALAAALALAAAVAAVVAL